MKRSGWFALIGIIGFSILIRTVPLYDFTLWGMDCGEYLYYTHQWVKSGQAYTSIDGWGTAYPYFPGMFILAGSFSMLSGADLIFSTTFIPVLISGLSPLFVFLMVHKLMDDHRPALLSAFFLSGLPPIIYSYSQPKPETLGFFLMLFVLTLSVASLRDHRKTVVALMVLGALASIVTHHLSVYFLLIMLLGGVFVSRLWRNKEWSLDKDRTILYTVFALLTVIYWIYYASPFAANRMKDTLVFPSYSIVIVPFAVLILIELIIRFRRRFDFSMPIKLHEQDSRSFIIFTGTTAVILIPVLLYISLRGFPVRGIELGFTTLIYSPVAFLSLFGVPSRKIIKALEEGPSLVGWFAFILLSLTVGVISGSSSLLPMRHITFLLLVISILFGIGVFQLNLVMNPMGDRNKTVALSLVVFLLLASMIPFIYPSQERAGGYQEGTEWGDMEGAFWLKRSSSGKVATDHRMSAAAFSVGYENLTWIDGEDMYFGSYEEASDELDDHNVSYIMWDQDMLEGTATEPGENPRPLDSELKENYSENHYRVYHSEECEGYAVP